MFIRSGILVTNEVQEAAALRCPRVEEEELMR
jgi:hypothetical protein